MGAINFTQTLHDSKIIPKALDQYERLNGKQPKEVFVDKGYRGINQYKESSIFVPKPDKVVTNAKRIKHSRRAAIEQIIEHLKQHQRLCIKYLKGILGDNMNLILAAATMNFKLRINFWRTAATRRWLLIFNYVIDAYWNFIAKKKN